MSRKRFLSCERNGLIRVAKMDEAAQVLEELGSVVPEEDFDRARLADYLRGKLEGAAEAPMEVAQFRGGHSNLTYLLRFGEREYVMRRPPLGPLPPSAHDMSREYRVLSRLWKAYAPAPRAFLFCDDRSVIGAPFFVMERRKGVVVRMRQPLPPELDRRPESLRALAFAFIDALADLHMVDYQAVGLGDLGKPEGFVERQIRGWMGRWDRAKTRDLPLMYKLGDWFLANQPPPQPPALIHNDFFLHNVAFDPSNQARVTGVFDWEMATLGDPMIDLGTSLGYWREAGDSEELISLSEGYPHTTLPGMPTREELARRYASRTGRDLSHLDFYRAWANWKTATVVEQIYFRYVRGQTHDERFALLGKHPPILARAAADIVKHLGFKE